MNDELMAQYAGCYDLVHLLYHCVFPNMFFPMFDFCSAEALLYDCDSSQYEAGSRLRKK